MSLLFGGGGGRVQPQYTGLALQTSASSLPIPIVWGQNRVAPNIIWQDDFAVHKQKQKAGKGGPSITSYTYSGSYQLGLCWGEIHDVVHVWKDQSTITDYAALGFTLFKGTTPQSPWGYLTSKHPDKALGYSGIAHLDVPNYDLGQSNVLAQHSFEVQGLAWGTGYNSSGPTNSAAPSTVINDYLSNTSFGVGFDLSVLQNLNSTGDATTTGDSAFQTYCRAIGFSLSPVLNGQATASDTVQRWCDLCNTAIVWTGYSIKFHPWGPDEIDNNGVKYLPDFPVRYQLTDSDFVFDKSSQPMNFSRKDPSEGYNMLNIVISNKDNQYNKLPVPWKDQGLIDQYGERPASDMEANEVTEQDMASVMVLLMGQKKGYIRNTFDFVLSSSFCLLEAMDVLQCTDPVLGTFDVIINSIEEQDDGTFTIEADEYIASVSSAGTNGVMSVSNNPVNTAAPAGPVNPPIIFEPGSQLSSVPQVWAAVSGGDGTTFDPNWGGAYVWLSTDGTNYSQIGTADHARMGKLTAGLATYVGSNPDTAHTLSVSLLMSNSELQDAASPADAAAGVTVSYVGGEFVSYEDATPTTANNFDCTNLYRGQYGSTVASHSTGAGFARLDDNIFKFNLPTNYIGVTLYLKFQSFNFYGGGVEDLSTCAVYNYVPTGAGYGTASGGVPQVPTSFAGASGPALVQLSWAPNPSNDNVTQWEVWRATGASQPFGSASRIASVAGNTHNYTDMGVTGGSTYTYFLVAVNAAGSSGNTAGINETPSAGAALSIWKVTATGTGSSQNITLPHSGVDPNGVFVFSNGVRMYTSEYSITGTTLTLTTNASGDSIEIIGVVS